MIRRAAVFAAAVAVLGVTIQSADARSQRTVDPRINTVTTVVGAGWTAGYFAINHWKWDWNSGRAGISEGGAMVLTTVGCAATSPMIATVALGRELTYREAHILIGSCVIPIIGGWLVNEAYNNGWIWAPDEKPVHKVSHRSRK
jgi:hypothetical protein